jgi:hypothetical protein
MNIGTAVPTVRQAQVELVALAECIHTTRGASHAAAYQLARLQRPELAVLLDANGAAPFSRQAVLMEATPKSAHEQLVALAENYREVHPGVTKERAYLAAWEGNPSVVAQLADEQHAEMRTMNLAERARTSPGSQPGYNASSQRPLTPTVPGDVAADPRHAGWMDRARELVKAGRVPTIEQGYVMAMKGL